MGVWEIQGHNHNFSLDLFHWWIISPLLKLTTISLLLGKNDFMSTGFSPWQFSPWATLDPFHPRCLHPFPEAAGACSYHCGNRGGYVHWRRSSAAPTLRPQTPGTLKDWVWSSWAWQEKKKINFVFNFVLADISEMYNFTVLHIK